MNRTKSRTCFFGVVALAPLLCGCATGRISLVRTDLSPGSLSKSDTILVGDFDSTNTPSFGDGHESPEAVDTQRSRLSEEIETRLVRHLEAKGFRAVRRRESGAATANAIVVEGELIHNDRGSWALRVWVGWGTGQSNLKASVRVHRAGSVLTDFDTEATSGNSAGWGGIGDFIPTDSENTAIAIANYLAEKAGG